MIVSIFLKRVTNGLPENVKEAFDTSVMNLFVHTTEAPQTTDFDERK